MSRLVVGNNTVGDTMVSPPDTKDSPKKGQRAPQLRPKLPTAVPKPDVESYHQEIEAGKKIIDDLFKQLNELSDRAAEAAQANHKSYRKQDTLRQNLDKIQQQLETLENERSRITAEIASTVQRGRDQKLKAQSARKALGYSTPEEIDARIREIERLMMAKRLTTMEENKSIHQIRQLREQKPLLEKYARQEATADDRGVSAAPLRARLEAIKEETRQCLQKRSDLQASLSALRSKRAEASGPAREMANQKEDLQRRIVEQRSHINRLQDDLLKKQQAFDAYQAQVQRINNEASKAEKQRKQILRQREHLEKQLNDIDEQAWSSELALTHQVAVYLRRLHESLEHRKENVPTGNSTFDEETRAKLLADAAVEGATIILPKKDREEEYYFAPKTKISKKKKRSSGEEKAATAPADQPLVHDIKTLADFQRLKVDPPYLPCEVAGLLAEVEKRLEEKKEAESLANANVQKRRADILAKLDLLEAEEKNLKLQCPGLAQTKAVDLDADCGPLAEIEAS